MSNNLQFAILWMSIVALIFVATFHNKFSIKLQKILVLLLIIVFTFMYSYRTLGLDLRNYVDYYNLYGLESLTKMIKPQNLFINQFEPIFTFWMYCSKLFNLSFQQSLFVYVLVPQLAFYYLIKKHSSCPLVAYMLYMVSFMFHFDLTRMFFAIPFALLGFYSNKKITKLFFYAVAFCAHFTTVLLLLYEMLSKQKYIVKLKFITLLIGSSVGSVFLIAVTTSLSNTSNRFIFKILYTLNNTSKFINTSQMIILTASCIYPTIMCYMFYKRYQDLEYFNDAVSKKTFGVLKVAIPISIVCLGLMGIRNVSRIILPASSLLFITASDLAAGGIRNGRISGEALWILRSLLIYDLLTSAYYVWVGLMY